MNIPTNEGQKWKRIVFKDKSTDQLIETQYYISTQGRVWSNLTKKLLSSGKFGLEGAKYYGVYLSVNGKAYMKKVHRLVAQAFIPNPNNLPIVNHKDENKLNNSVENLEWCTMAYNRTYGTAIERQATSISNTTSSIYVICHPYTGEVIDFGTLKECSEKYNIKKGSIENAVSGITKTAGGYSWARFPKDSKNIPEIGQIISSAKKKIPSSHIKREKHIQILDLQKNQIIYDFPTLTACAEFLKISKQGVRQRITYQTKFNGGRYMIVENKQTIILPSKEKKSKI